MVLLTVTSAPAAADEAQVRVKRAKQLLKDARQYPKGCSEFVCEVINRSGEDANTLMGLNPKYVGVNGEYRNLNPGDVVGWSGTPHGHVAIYIGERDIKFIDVHEVGQKPRSVKGYGDQKLFKSSRY